MHRTLTFRRDQSGSILIQVLTMVGVAGIMAGILTQKNAQAIRLQKHESLQEEREMLRLLLAQTVDCRRTFADAGIDPMAPAGRCAATSTTDLATIPATNHLTLKTRGGSVLVAPNGVLNEWTVDAACSETERTLIVRVARYNGGAPYIDQYDQKALDWSHPRALLFGETAALRWSMCQVSFTVAASGGDRAGAGSFDCPPNQVMTDVTLTATGPTGNCKPSATVGAPACPAGQAMYGIDASTGLPLCRAVLASVPTTCPGGSMVRGYTSTGQVICDGRYLKDLTTSAYGAHAGSPACPGGYISTNGWADCALPNRFGTYDTDYYCAYQGACGYARGVAAECNGSQFFCRRQ